MASNDYEINLHPFVNKIFKNIKTIIIAVIIIIVGWSTAFQIGPEEVGVITRFGKFTRTVESGLHFKMPFVEGLVKVPVERQQKQEFGYRTTSAGVKSQYSKSGTKDESLMLTGDLNLADVEWVVQYRIDNPYNFLFKVRNAENTLRDISEASMRQIVGDRTVNEVLTVGRAEIAGKMKAQIQDLSNEYTLGLRVEQVVLQDVNPPDEVKAAFNAVNQAQQQKETLINEAKSAYNKVIPRARGQAEETIQMAQGYATKRVNNAKGNVARFNALYGEYIQAPEVTKRRIYLETMNDVIPKLGEKIITDNNGSGVLPLLNMDMQKMRNNSQSRQISQPSQASPSNQTSQTSQNQ